jgi:hypothetical protein
MSSWRRGVVGRAAPPPTRATRMPVAGNPPPPPSARRGVLREDVVDRRERHTTAGMREGEANEHAGEGGCLRCCEREEEARRAEDWASTDDREKQARRGDASARRR